MKRRYLKDEIVNTATRLFYTQGYGNTGINQIIRDAKVAKSSLYEYFSSKEDLLMACLTQTGERDKSSLVTVADRYEKPEDKVLAIFGHLEKMVQQEDFYGCHFLNVVFEATKDEKRIRDEVRKYKDELRSLFRKILKPINKEDLADEIYTLLQGALIGSKVHGDSWPFVAAANIVKKLL
jgi:AcrR family transcriptional regulator